MTVVGLADAKLCTVCKGDGWVCENHPKKAWKDGRGCCGGAGMPCECNPNGDPPFYMKVVWDINRGFIQ